MPGSQLPKRVAGQGDIDVRSRQILTDRPVCVDTIGRCVDGRLRIKRKMPGRSSSVACSASISSLIQSTTVWTEGSDLARLSTHPSLFVKLSGQGRRKSRVLCMPHRCLSISQRAVTRFCPQQVRRQEKRQAYRRQSLHRYRIAPQIMCADNLYQIFCTTKTFCANNLLPDPYWAKNDTLDVRRPLAKFKRA